jgi:putative peptidoglycan lipid II flippase
LRLAAVSAVGRSPAFLIPIIIAALFGAGHETDGYFLAYSAVLFLGGTIAQGLEQAIVPFAASQLHNHPGLGARRYFDGAARGGAYIAAACWLVGTPVFLAAAGESMRSTVLRYAGFFTPLVLAWCAAAVFGGALVSQWRIGTATGSLMWRGIGALLGLAFVPLGRGLWSVALGLGVGEVARVFWLRSRLFALTPSAGVAEFQSLRPLAAAAVAQSLASAAIAAAPLVERFLASSLGVGGISHLEYAMRLLVIPSVLFDGALAPLLLARWSAAVTHSTGVSSRWDVLRPVWRGVLLAGACAALLSLFAKPFVHTLLGHGRFDVADEVAVASLLHVLALGFVATMGALLLERYYLATVRNRTLAALSVVRAAVRLTIVVLLLRSYGLLAFAIGYTIADWGYLLALVGLLPSSWVSMRTSAVQQAEES